MDSSMDGKSSSPLTYPFCPGPQKQDDVVRLVVFRRFDRVVRTYTSGACYCLERWSTRACGCALSSGKGRPAGLPRWSLAKFLVCIMMKTFVLQWQNLKTTTTTTITTAQSPNMTRGGNPLSTEIFPFSLRPGT